MSDARTTAILSKFLAPKPSAKEAYGNSLENNEMLAKLTGTGKFKDTGRAADNIGESIDSLTGVPLRTAIAEAQAGNFNLDAVKKIAASIGADPRKAPTGFDIASKVTSNPLLGSALATTVDLANAPMPIKPGVQGVVKKVADTARKAAANQAVVQHIKSTPALQSAMAKLAKGEPVSFQTGVDTRSQAKIKQLAQDLALKGK